MVIKSTDENQKALASEDNGMKGKFIQLFSHAFVHIYFINPEEEGATKRDTTTVRLVMIPLDDGIPPAEVVIPPAFVEAGGWFYPLIPKETPVYRTEEKYYIFPDLLSSKGASVGIVFPECITNEERDLFEDVLLNLAGMDKFPTGFAEKFGNPGGLINTIDAVETLKENESQPMDTNTEFPVKSIAGEFGADIMSVAGKAADGISAGATRAFEFMGGTGRANVGAAKDYAGNAVEISGHGISRLVDATSKLAVFSTHYVTSTTSAGMETVLNQAHKGTSAICNGVTAASDGAMNYMGIVYEALHNAGKTLAHAITHNHVMDHRYGAGKSGHIMELGPKALAAVNDNLAKSAKSAGVHK